MSIGIRLHDAQGATFEQKVATAKALGFECAHVAISKVLSPAWMCPAALTPGLADFMRAAMGSLDTAVLGCYLNLAQPEGFSDVLANYTAHLRFARWLGASVVGTETGNPNMAYSFDPQTSHTDEALRLFISRLRPVVEAAEKLGSIIAIEPVCRHIVCDAKRARYVLDEIHSPNLQIIFDPVNLLDPTNVENRDALILEAFQLLRDDIAVLHVKDFILANGTLSSVAVGEGVMDYRPLLSLIRQSKPHLHMTLEDTTPANAAKALAHFRALVAEDGDEDVQGRCPCTPQGLRP